MGKENKTTNKKGKLIIIEAVDGCGKKTQTKLLYENLKNLGYKCKKISFPNYKSESSAPVRLYLNGELSNNADDINAYMASTFYAVDRAISFKKDWEKWLDKGYIIISDRYTVSNMIHQGSKIEGKELLDYIEWLKDLEYNKIGLPVPDKIFYLDVPTEVSSQLRSNRKQELKVDIHEENEAFIIKSYNNAKNLCRLEGWHEINCTTEEGLRSVENIGNELLGEVVKVIRG